MNAHVTDPTLASEREIMELIEGIPAGDQEELDATGRELLEDNDQARSIVGIVRGLRRATLQLQANKQILDAIKGDYKQENSLLESRISKLQHLAEMFIRRQEEAGGRKSFDIPRVGRVSATKVPAGWKITDARQARAWLEEQALLRPEFQSWTLLAGATQDAMDELIAAGGGEIPPGVEWVDDHNSISFRLA